MRRRHLLPLLLLAIVAGAMPAASATSPHPSGQFTVLAYNVAGLPEGISKSSPSKNSPLISERLNDYELVLLQEDWADPLHPEGAHEETEGLPSTYFHHLIVSKSRHPYRSEPASNPVVDATRAGKGPATVSDGLNRLSAFPFGKPVLLDTTTDGRRRVVERVMWNDCFGEVRSTVVETALDEGELRDRLPEDTPAEVDEQTRGGGADCGAQKGFSVATTTLADGVLVDVYNVHADSGGDREDVAARAKNFQQLAAYIEMHSRGRAVLLGGDTNLKAGSTNVERATTDAAVWTEFQERTGLVDVCAAIDCGADALVHDKIAFRNTRSLTFRPLAHAFERAKFTEGGTRLSDHDPVAVTFSWRAKSRPVPVGR